MPELNETLADVNKELYRTWRDERVNWDTTAREDIDFANGNHFTEDEVDEMESRNQAAVPMDRIGSAIDNLKASLTSRPPMFQITPREDSDAKIAQIWNSILQYNWELSDGNMQVKNALHDYATTGLGYLYVYIDYDEDLGRGEVKFKHLSPFRVYVPSSSRDRFFDDAEGIIVSTIMTGEQLVSLYPELGNRVNENGEIVEDGIINELSATMEEDYPASQQSNTHNTYTPAEVKDKDILNYKFQVLERFYRTRVPFVRLIDKRQQQVEEIILSEDEFEVWLQEEQNVNALTQGFVDKQTVFQTRIGSIATVDDYVLYDEILSTDVYPVIPLLNQWTETPFPKSDVSRAKPVQRLLNKLWSLALSHAQSSAGLKLIVPIGFALNGIDELESQWANPNAVIEGDTSVGEPHYPQPQPLAAEFYRLIQQCEFYIDFIFGLPEMMQGFSEKAPETARGIERLASLGSQRPKSKLRDIEFALTRLGRVLYNFDKGHYTFKKVFRLIQPNNDLTEVMVNIYDDASNAIADFYRERHLLSRADIRIEPGSTLPNSKWNEFKMYLEAYSAGLVDNVEVIKKNPSLFDKEGILKRMDERQKMSQYIQQLEQQIKSLKGDLQTAQREAVHDRQRVEVEKTKSDLKGIVAQAQADRKISREKLQNEVQLIIERLENQSDSMETSQNKE